MNMPKLQKSELTVYLASAPSNAVIAVARYSGVDTASPLGNLLSGNTNGLDGICSDGIDSNAYSFNLTTTVDHAMVYVAVAPRMRDNTPGAAYTERAEVYQGSSGTAGVSIADGTVSAISAVLVDGALSSETDWAVIAVEIKPGSGGMGRAAVGTSLASADESLLAATNYQSNVASNSPLSAAGNLIGRLWSWFTGQLSGFWQALTPSPAAAAPPAGVIFRSYYYVGGQRVAIRVEGESDPAKNGLFYLLSDHLGSTTVTLKDTGSLSKASELRYKPWGLTRGSGYADSLTPTDSRFTGQRWEGGTGLYSCRRAL
jgi:hypothetical protein